MTETVETTATGAILYDRAIINRISSDCFGPQGWVHAEPLQGELGSGGRGNTMLVGNVPRQFVLRHYRRGGLVGRLIQDRYFWAGEQSTRSFAEWRMLKKMVEFDLPVPRPAAARYLRHGAFYTADIITVTIPNVRPLSSVIAEAARDAGFWSAIGAAIRRFHEAGVFHADMSAHNLQVDHNDCLWMLDFDKGCLKAPGPWQQQTLNRLNRSLKKICTNNPGIHFGAAAWEALLTGYFQASRSA